MVLFKFIFFILFCIRFQCNGNICAIYDCQQNSSSGIPEKNLNLITKLTSCVVARNYDGLFFSIVIEKYNYQKCSWIFANDFLDSNRDCVDYSKGVSFNKRELYTSFATCVNQSSPNTIVKERTCVRSQGKNYYSIVFGNILFDDFLVSAECGNTPTKGFHIKVRPCSSVFGEKGNQVYVKSNSRDYNAVGSFRCNSSGKLFYSNGTLAQDSSTRCLATAHWKEQNNMKCWKEPSRVQLKGNYDWVNGSRLFLRCIYSDEFPIGHKSIFYVNNTVNKILPKGETFYLAVNRTFNDVPVSCQAQTPFTEIYKQTGKSKEHFLNVLFAPYLVQQKSCIWLLNTNESCNIEIFSNANVSVVSLFRNGEDITNSSNFFLSVLNKYSHVFTLIASKNTENNSGTYNLTLHSIVPPYYHHLWFIIHVLQHHSTTTTSSENIHPETLFVVGAILCVLLLIILFVIVFVIWKKK